MPNVCHARERKKNREKKSPLILVIWTERKRKKDKRLAGHDNPVAVVASWLILRTTHNYMLLFRIGSAERAGGADLSTIH